MTVTNGTNWDLYLKSISIRHHGPRNYVEPRRFYPFTGEIPKTNSYQYWKTTIEAILWVINLQKTITTRYSEKNCNE